MGWCCSSVVTCLACGRPHFPASVPQRRKKRNGEGITYLVCDILGKLFNLYVSISSLRKWRNNSHLAECCKVWVRLYTMHSGRDEYVLMMAFLIKCDCLSEVTSIQSCLMLFLVESTCGWGTQGKALSVAALLNITKAGVVVWSGRDTPQIISKQKNGGVLVCLIWMCTIQLKLYNELCTIAGWNRSSLNSRNFRACGMWALFMSFPSYLKLLVWKCRKFYHFRHQN